MAVNKFPRLSPFSDCKKRSNFLHIETLGGDRAVGISPSGDKFWNPEFMRTFFSSAGGVCTGGLLLLTLNTSLLHA